MKYSLVLFALIIAALVNAQEILKVTYSSQMRVEDDFGDMDAPTTKKEEFKKLMK